MGNIKKQLRIISFAFILILLMQCFVGINVFESGESLMGVKFLTPCSVIIDSDKFYITDPTQTLSEIKLEFLKDISVASEHDVTVSGRVVTIKMPIKGKSYSFTVSEI